MGQESRNYELNFLMRGHTGIQELRIDRREEDGAGIQEFKTEKKYRENFLFLAKLISEG